MKKSVYYLLAMMMVAMMSVGFASCGGDDDESPVPNPNGSTSGDSNPSGGGSDGETLTLTIDGETVYKATGFASRLAFKNGATGVPSTATYMDAEDKSQSTCYYTLDFCFSPFSLEDVGTELKLCPSVSLGSMSGIFPDVSYGSTNTLWYCKIGRSNDLDMFAYVSGKITLHSWKIGEAQIKYDNVVLECVAHSNVNVKRDKVVLNGICAYDYSTFK